VWDNLSASEHALISIPAECSAILGASPTIPVPMFREPYRQSIRPPRAIIIGLVALSLAALAVTAWTMVDFLREQVIVQELITKLPTEARPPAVKLAGELRLQFRLTILVVLNLIVTGFAVVLLWRAYGSSQESLRDIKALADDILGSIDQAVITTDGRGAITSINRRGSELFGLTGEVFGQPLSELSNDLNLESFRQEANARLPQPISKDFTVPKDGYLATFRSVCQPLFNREQSVIGNVVQVRDVTEPTLIEQRMRRMERYMGLGSLAAGLHHEIKNPLAALSLHVQLLEEELEASRPTAEVQDMLEVIQTEVARVGGVLESFRDFASLGQLNLTHVDLDSLVQRQLRLLAPRARQQRVHTRLILPDQPLPVVQADRVRLEQVLVNLLVNALEAMPDGGDLTIHVTDHSLTHPPSLRVAVEDTGPGIPESLCDRIFDPYFTTKRDGTGMGLAICDKIISQHKGSLEYHRAGTRTVFEFSLPVPPFASELDGDHDAGQVHDPAQENQE
jgi:two-component system nitrogen regulation sensor histidine kinase GlnL